MVRAATTVFTYIALPLELLTYDVQSRSSIDTVWQIDTGMIL